MTSISPVTALSKMAKSKLFEKYLYKPATENPAKFAGQMALLSALTKDAVNCYYYTTQSLNNEKIPEDKRGFVAAMDLVNGVINVGLQFTLGAWIDKNSGDWFNKIVGEKLDTNKTTEIAKKVADTLKVEHAGENISTAQIKNYLIEKSVLGLKGGKMKWLGIGFSTITMLIATQVISKRVFTPFLAPPIAGWVKEKFFEKHKAQKDRVYYEWASLQPKYNNDMDKTAFSSVATRRTTSNI